MVEAAKQVRLQFGEEEAAKLEAKVAAARQKKLDATEPHWRQKKAWQKLEAVRTRAKAAKTDWEAKQAQAEEATREYEEAQKA